MGVGATVLAHLEVPQDEGQGVVVFLPMVESSPISPQTPNSYSTSITLKLSNPSGL